MPQLLYLLLSHNPTLILDQVIRKFLQEISSGIMLLWLQATLLHWAMILWRQPENLFSLRLPQQACWMKKVEFGSLITLPDLPCLGLVCRHFPQDGDMKDGR